MDKMVSPVGSEPEPDDPGPESTETRAIRVAHFAAQRASKIDTDGAFPSEDVEALHSSGLLTSPFPPTMGGEGLGIGDPDRLRQVLVSLGRGSLSLGRLYEGHVNAVVLAVRYGSQANLALLMAEAVVGRPSGVWMAGEPLRLERNGPNRLVLRGHKVLCSGAGHFSRPLVAADHEGGSIMVLPFVGEPARVDISGWKAQGMRATATGTVSFDAIEVGASEIVGAPGDYLRSPFFKGGAWRVLAVQLGGLEAVLDAYRHLLKESPHGTHPIQLGRFGEAEIACETARLWVQRAAVVAEGSIESPEAVDAYVDLARNAFERAALDVVALSQKAIGLKAFLRPNSLERIVRDLTTYLRQPALDVSLMSAAAFRLGWEGARH